MELNLVTRINHAFNAFMNRDPTPRYDIGPGYSIRPDRVRLTGGNERSITSSIYNRIALDVASLTFQHCKTDEDGNYLDVIKDSLNKCLTLEANIDQTGRSFIQDIVMSMFDEGAVAIVPVDTDRNPDIYNTGSYGIETMRTGKILTWYPREVRVRLYDDRDGIRKEITVPKTTVGIIENPFFAVMNEPNSTAKRLTHKLSLLDATDDHNASGKIDLIIQLPYLVKGENRKRAAEQRRRELVDQLAGSQYGIGYIDGSEKITQLNRSIENQLMKQIEYLTNLLFSQLNITQSILDGTADEKTMLNYYTRTIEPIASAIIDEFKRKFLTGTARTQGQSIMFFRDPFKLVPVTEIAEISDKMTRNEILTRNEIRPKIGYKPSKDPKANELHNSNISQSKQENTTTNNKINKEEENQNG